MSVEKKQVETYEKHLLDKQKRLQEIMGEFCKLDPILGMEQPYYYRNKVAATFGHEKSNPIYGVYKPEMGKVIPIEDGNLNSKKASAIIETIKGLLKSFKIKTYEPKTGHGLLRHVLVREAQKTGEVMVVLVLSSHIMPSKNNFVKALRAVHPEIDTVIINENYKMSEKILGEKESTIYGKGFILDSIADKMFRVSSKSMYPINPEQTVVLSQKIKEFAGCSKEDILLDAYCGIGTIGILLSNDVKKIISVDSKPLMIRDAISNTKRNQIKNIDYYTKDVVEFVNQVAKSEKQKPNIVIMDPPKHGCEKELAKAISNMGSNKVIYIGRSTHTLVEDLRQLTSCGYRVDRAVGVDMQPWREHVETVVLLVKKG